MEQVKPLTYQYALDLVRERAGLKYDFSTGQRLEYLVKGFYEQSERDISRKVASRRVSTLCERFGQISERQLRRVLEQFEEIVITKWRNRMVSYRFDPKPLENFDIIPLAEERERKEKAALQRHAEQMKQHRAMKKQKLFAADVQQFIRSSIELDSRIVPTDVLIRTLKAGIPFRAFLAAGANN